MVQSRFIGVATTFVIASIISSGCAHHRNNDELASSKNYARSLYIENQNLLQAQMNQQQSLMGLENEKQLLWDHMNGLESELATANERVRNLMAERDALNQQYSKALTGDPTMVAGNAGGLPLNAENFEYDAATGLNKFRSDVLFDLGSDILRPEAGPILAEFADSVKSGSAAGMRVLIVGHTDDVRVARPETIQHHPTNWHLSTDRAAAVILALKNQGVPESQMCAMGYGEFQPLESSSDDVARQRNRRVELYVVPKEPNVAQWDPATSIR
ncbi:MAG: OmpA family protein [Planctomyces sp.]|nr:OmpA family protein [Planctomyces sp.]